MWLFLAGVAYLLALQLGIVGPAGWLRVTLLLVVAAALFIVVTVPDHFLDAHLWEHVVRRHVPRLFAWTFAAVAVMTYAPLLFAWDAFIQDNPWTVLGIAAGLGVVPESGPHLIFVTLYERGDTPFSVLLASSMVQDGHGMLPLLAHSGRDFVTVKAINLVIGLSVGALLLAAGT